VWHDNSGPGNDNEDVVRRARVFLDRQRQGPLLTAGFHHSVELVDDQVGEHLTEFRHLSGHPELAARTEADLEINAGVELQVGLGPRGKVWVPGNETELGQVLANLMINAVDAMTEAGSEERSLSLAVQENSGDTLDVFIDDTGPGIPEQHLERVFEPFFSTRKAVGGTGLGLSISQEIVRRHGGDLFASNLPSGGCRLTLRLQMMARPRPQSKENDE